MGPAPMGPVCPCRRADFFYRIWTEADAPPDFEYNQGHVDEYLEDAEWLDFMIALPGDGASFGRGMEIRRLVPRLGPAGAGLAA